MFCLFLFVFCWLFDCCFVCYVYVKLLRRKSLREAVCSHKYPCSNNEIHVLFDLFDLILYVPSTIFQLKRDGTCCLAMAAYLFA